MLPAPNVRLGNNDKRQVSNEIVIIDTPGFGNVDEVDLLRGEVRYIPSRNQMSELRNYDCTFKEPSQGERMQMSGGGNES